MALNVASGIAALGVNVKRYSVVSTINEQNRRLTFTPFVPPFLDLEGVDELLSVLAAFA